ncbi:MAG: hypothetical protein N2C14_09975, partial [Planctomycetales bacterium]
EQGLADADQIRSLQRRNLVESAVGVASACARGKHRVIHLSSRVGRIEGEVSATPLEVFRGACELLDDAPRDLAKSTYEEYAHSARAAMLMVLSKNPSSLPTPVGLGGEGTGGNWDSLLQTLEEMGVLRQAVHYVSQWLTKFPAEAFLLSLENGAWLGVKGTDCVSLFRFENHQLAARVLSKVNAEIRRDRE